MVGRTTLSFLVEVKCHEGSRGSNSENVVNTISRVIQLGYIAKYYKGIVMSSKVLEVGSVNVFEKYNFCHQNTTIGTLKYSFHFRSQRMAGLWYTCRWSTVKIQSLLFLVEAKGHLGSPVVKL